ncbi:MAG: hypothetical protein OIN85_03740 [Candidatus Methanoperedens sp.]|nr:hypothetical protein [Candidatus Methanoperedens sp.]
MVKKINQHPLIRFGFFVIVWIFIYFLIGVLNPIFGYDKNNNGQGLLSIFWIIILFPVFIKNIIQNIHNLNLIDSNYFWSLGFGGNILWGILFWIFACLYFAFILTLLSGDNERIKNKILQFHFGLLTYALFLGAIDFYFKNPQDPKYTITIARGNLLGFLSIFVDVAINVYILTRIKKEIDFEFLKNTIEKYLFTISEFLLTLFIALIFYNYLLSPDASLIDRVSYPLQFLVLGFFLFLCIQLIRNNYKIIFKYLNYFHNRQR